MNDQSVKIEGKYPTGPNCYDGEPRRRSDDGKPTVRIRPLGVPRPYILTDETRTALAESGRKRAKAKAERKEASS